MRFTRNSLADKVPEGVNEDITETYDKNSIPVLLYNLCFLLARSTGLFTASSR